MATIRLRQQVPHKAAARSLSHRHDEYDSQ
jgi:hypothetical protein